MNDREKFFENEILDRLVKAIGYAFFVGWFAILFAALMIIFE